MKLTFLGTSAGEGYPARFCECPHCDYARKHGGRNLRVNSCAMVDDKLLLDMNAAGYDQAARLSLSLSKVHTLLVTHPHEDHLSPQELYWRATSPGNDQLPPDMPFEARIKHGGPRFTPVPHMTIYGTPFTGGVLDALKQRHANQDMLWHFEEATPGVGFDAGEYTVMPVRGNHGAAGFTVNYVITKGDKTFLYALDTGEYDEETLALLSTYHFDVIVMEDTAGYGYAGDGHMTREKNLKIRDYFKRSGALGTDGRFILSHMSPHWTPPYDMYVSDMAKEGVMVAYDGLSIEI